MERRAQEGKDVGPECLSLRVQRVRVHQSLKAQSHEGPAEQADSKGGQSPVPNEKRVPDPVLKSLQRD